VKIAVPVENGMVFQHFGKTKSFMLYDAAEGKITGKRLLDAGENGHAALAGLLQSQGVELLICGGIGGGAREALARAGVRLAAGVSGSADSAVEGYLSGTLDFDNDAVCTHHAHLPGEGHDCGSHSCGHDCGH